MIIKRPENEKIESALVGFHEKFIELRGEVSELRRMGKETGILDLRLMEVEPLIKMAKATYEDKDVGKVGQAVQRIVDEINLVKTGDPFQQIQALITDTYQLLRQGNKALAAKNWPRIQELYSVIPKDLQKTVYRACFDLREKVG